MKTMLKFAPAAVVLTLLAACGSTMEQRAATGAIGGAVVGQAVGFPRCGRRGGRRCDDSPSSALILLEK